MVFIHTIAYSGIFRLRHPSGLTDIFSHTINLSHMHSHYFSWSNSLAWTVSCTSHLPNAESPAYLQWSSLPTHGPWRSLWHFRAHTGSHTLFWLLSLFCSPSACSTVTDAQSPLPSHKHYFTHTTSFSYSTLITHSVLQWFSATQPWFLT